MRPTLDQIINAPKELAAQLMSIRASRHTRYAHAPQISQQQRRRADRRTYAHGW